MSTPKNVLYTKHLEVDIPLTNKEILQRIYDRLTIKSTFDKTQDIYKRFDEFLQANKNIKGKELDEAISKVVSFLKKQNPDTLINEDDIKFIKSRASK
jgi:predicted small metal-binding protein